MLVAFTTMRKYNDYDFNFAIIFFIILIEALQLFSLKIADSAVWHPHAPWIRPCFD